MNYEPLHAFAEKHRVSYNELCTALRAALAQPEPIDGFGGNLDEAFEPAAPAPAPAVCCRNELLTALHTLASNYENALGMFGQDGEGRRKAEGDLAHAMKVAAKHNRNGPGCAAPAVPLTEEWIAQFSMDVPLAYEQVEKIVRHVEQAHGIGGGGK